MNLHVCKSCGSCRFFSRIDPRSDGGFSEEPPQLYDDSEQTLAAPILSTDAVVRKPVVVTAADGSESIAIHSVGNLALTFDHRAIDGAYAARFLRRMGDILATRDWNADLQ